MAMLTIIVPVYNVEQYLARCLDSILAQTFSDFELILINDGSPDNSAEIMEEYARKDPRIITIHKENGGVCSARNAGLRIATGTYVGFVDPDDYINSEMYESMIAKIQESGADIACCNWAEVYEDGTVKKHVVDSVPEYMTQEEFAMQLFAIPRTIAGSNCNKLYCRSLITDFYDENVSICEDNLFNAKYLLNVSHACYLNKVLYFVFQRSNSATRTNKGKAAEGLKVRLQMIEIMSKISGKAECFAEYDYLDSSLGFYHSLDIDNPYYPIAKEAFFTYAKKHFFKVMGNPVISWKNKVLYCLTLLHLK